MAPCRTAAIPCTAAPGTRPNSAATFVATFHATHKGDGGPIAPTNKATNTDYVYSVKMNGDGKVTAMTKIWNDGFALAELGWA